MHTDVLRRALTGTSAARVIAVFDCVDVAGELLEDAFPNRSEEPKGLFMLLQPPAPMQGKAVALYRAHAAELVRRAKAGGDLRLATRAEVLVALLATSLKAPLRSEAQACAETLFAEVFPGVVPQQAREAWAGQVEADIAEAQRRLSVSDRVLAAARRAA